ncbi:MAG: hypothetical protein PHE36_11270, partial [Novosphingobium sp.]|nr:hypothetical protein [Novosphingobium sp.]
VGCSRETAYRLRRKPGAESFTAAWDAVLAIRGRAAGKGGKMALHRKVTPGELPVLAYDGPVCVRMFAGRFAGTVRKPSNTALLRLLASYDRALRHIPPGRWP